MSGRTTVFAYTEPEGSYPAYLNVSQDNETGEVIFTVRSRGGQSGQQMRVPADVAKALGVAVGAVVTS